MNTSYKTAKYRPYLSVNALEYMYLIAENKVKELNNLVILEEEQREELNTCKEMKTVIGKILLSIESGKMPDYKVKASVNRISSIEDKLGITQELTDQQKLDKMSRSEQLKFWIEYNRKEFNIEPTQEQLQEVEESIRLEIEYYE